MSIWVQHGYGKGDKIERLLEADGLSGVVLSPADETRSQMSGLVSSLKDSDIEFVLDPQLYVYTIEAGVGRCHKSHQLDFTGQVHWSLSASAIKGHVDAVIAANKALGIRTLVSPSPLQATFLDFWSPLALQYARTTLEGAGRRPVFASVIVEEEGLGDWETIEAWLDTATQLEVAGFYVIIARNDVPYPEAWNYKRLANYMRLIYRLHDAEYRVITGYTDIEALALAAVGGQPATGWFYTQRRFTKGKWRRGGGGQAPIPRILSESLLVPLQAPEALRILRSQQAALVTSDQAARQLLLAGNWSLGSARFQFLGQLAKLVNEVKKEDTVPERVGLVAKKMSTAASRIRQLGGAGLLVTAPSYERVVESIRRAVDEFVTVELS